MKDDRTADKFAEARSSMCAWVGLYDVIAAEILRSRQYTKL